MDRQRIVRPNADWSTITTLIDLTSAPAYQPVADTWQVTPPPRKPQVAVDERRYGGARTVGETHDNGAVSWITLVSGASADATLDNMSALLAQLEQVVPGLYVEWRPDGATNSTYYEVRGPATWKPNYRWVQFAGVKSLTCEVQVPVAPLAVSAPMVIGPFTQDLPAVIELDEPIPGDASALAAIKIGLPSGETAPAWALLAWTPRPSAGTLPPPFGIIDHAAGPVDTTLTDDYFFSFSFDFSRVPADDFTDTLSVEVWGRFELASTIITPRAVLSGTGHVVAAEEAFSVEFGALGCPLPKPSSGSAWRMVRLGTLTFAPEEEVAINVHASWDGASTGDIDLDYLLLTRAGRRAVGATAKTLDSSYPAFFPFAGDTLGDYTEKAVLSDLSGRFGIDASAAGSLPPSVSAGVGGNPIELPPGDVDLLVKLSTLVPDDPTSDTSSEQATHADMDVTVLVQPRWFLARGT